VNGPPKTKRSPDPRSLPRADAEPGPSSPDMKSGTQSDTTPAATRRGISPRMRFHLEQIAKRVKSVDGAA
jgi:hypothetical protein